MKKAILYARIMFIFTIVGEVEIIESILNLLNLNSNLFVVFIVYCVMLYANITMGITITDAIKNEAKQELQK